MKTNREKDLIIMRDAEIKEEKESIMTEILV